VQWSVPRCVADVVGDVRGDGGLAARQAAVDAFNAENRYRKRGLAMCPTKFGIAFTAKFMNQVSFNLF